MAADTPHEFRRAARHFTRTHLAFLDRNWLGDVLEDVLAGLLHTTVKEHTSTTSNTALRDATKDIAELADHTLRYLPSDARRCRCEDLNDGEHKPQPICHYCSIQTIKARATKALDTP